MNEEIEKHAAAIEEENDIFMSFKRIETALLLEERKRGIIYPGTLFKYIWDVSMAM